jgi:hypothetical protein
VHGAAARLGATVNLWRRLLGDLMRGDDHKQRRDAPYLLARVLDSFTRTWEQRRRGNNGGDELGFRAAAQDGEVASRAGVGKFGGRRGFK